MLQQKGHWCLLVCLPIQIVSVMEVGFFPLYFAIQVLWLPEIIFSGCLFIWLKFNSKILIVIFFISHIKLHALEHCTKIFIILLF